MAEPAPDIVARGYEPDQPHLRGVAWGAASIVAAVLVAIGVGFFVTRGLHEDETAETPRHQPPVILGGGPTLQATPRDDFPAFHAEKERLLHQYGWVDRGRGVVRIPIERAMALLVQRQSTKGTRP